MILKVQLKDELNVINRDINAIEDASVEMNSVNDQKNQERFSQGNVTKDNQKLDEISTIKDSNLDLSVSINKTDDENLNRKKRSDEKVVNVVV